MFYYLKVSKYSDGWFHLLFLQNYKSEEPTSILSSTRVEGKSSKKVRHDSELSFVLKHFRIKYSDIQRFLMEKIISNACVLTFMSTMHL